ncbi:MAG: hypothetical protein JWO38_4973 [Gemmataceae bacterium]|nr:hypothetical protein [Gemmataceae bacterium]
MDEISLLMGTCKEPVRTRLREAAAALAGDEVTAPARRRGEKRLQKG